MVSAYVAPILSAALKKFKEVVRAHSESGGSEGKSLIVFCEDRLSLVAERAVCEEVGGTFSVQIFTLSRFLYAEDGGCDKLLTSQGSAMIIKRLIEKNRKDLLLFKKLSTATAAQDVYDTIALLYSSKIKPEDLSVEASNGLLSRKLHDLQLLYAEYMQYLEESGAVDRNVYLRRLPDVIRYSEKIQSSDVMFFGFQAFTSSVADCVRAAMESAENVYGLFIGGKEKKYVNEGWSAFAGIAREYGYERVCTSLESGLCPEAEHIRRCVFEPESYHTPPIEENGRVRIIEAADVDEECVYTAAHVLKRVTEDGVRYREISVMLPDVELYQPALERAFAEFGIPLYVDRRYPLSAHPVCSFICDYLTALTDGCLTESVIAVVSSPMFVPLNCGLEKGESVDLRTQKDTFINYLLRAGAYRGAVRRAVNADICAAEGIDAAAVESVRVSFLKGLELFGKSGTCQAIRNLLELFCADKRLEELAATAERFGQAASAAMSARAYQAVMQVIDEAEKLTAGEKIGLKEFIKILKSGFTAAEISLIQPKQDAVFVGDLSACANTGSKVLFVLGLTEGVPSCSQDTAILTDGELVSLDKLHVAVAPKISQVNARVRELTALNLCAFSQNLYLLYPARQGGEECGRSEATAYVSRIFTRDGGALLPISAGEAAQDSGDYVYFLSRPQPAFRSVIFHPDGKYAEETKALLKELGCRSERTAYSAAERLTFERGKLFGGSVSPTALESYFTCPYKAFMQQGLKLNERREGTLRPLDSGNFIHAVLEKVANGLNDCKDEADCVALAEAAADELLKTPSYTVSDEDKGAGYAAEKLKAEACEIALGMYEQLKNSNFKVEATERKCRVKLGDMSVGGRIDRIDSCGDMVRVIDYKTGSVDDAPSAYYMGLKLQLPLYLSAAAEGRRAAGAYYFPANTDYSEGGGTDFTLKGFMDGSEDVVKSSDTTVRDSERSRYVGAYLNGRKLDKAMPQEDFACFIAYSGEIAKRGADELVGGSVAPSPVENACEYCPFGSCCGYDKDVSGEREKVSAKCADVVEVMRGRGDKR